MSYLSPMHTAVAYGHLAKTATDIISNESHQPFPVTLLQVTGPEQPQHPERLVQYLKDAICTDNVLNEAWTHTIVLTLGMAQQSQEKMPIACAEMQALLQQFPHSQFGIEADINIEPSIGCSSKRVHQVKLYHTFESTMSLHGPYLALASEEDIQLFPVYRLYPDTQRAFVYGMYKPVQQPSGDGTIYKQFCKVNSDGDLLIPVPSRLYSQTRSRAKPLSGLRLAVKGLVFFISTSWG